MLSLPSAFSDVWWCAIVVVVALFSALIGHCGYLHNKSRYFDVASAWFQLTFTHRREVLVLRDFARLMGMDFQFVADADMVMVSSGLAAVASALCMGRKLGASRALALH